MEQTLYPNQEPCIWLCPFLKIVLNNDRLFLISDIHQCNQRLPGRPQREMGELRTEHQSDIARGETR